MIEANNTLPLDTALKKLREAQRLYDEAHQDARAASRRETEAMNSLNAAQRQFDASVSSIKTGAPTGSDWTKFPVSTVT